MFTLTEVSFSSLTASTGDFVTKPRSNSNRSYHMRHVSSSTVAEQVLPLETVLESGPSEHPRQEQVYLPPHIQLAQRDSDIRRHSMSEIL